MIALFRCLHYMFQMLALFLGLAVGLDGLAASPVGTAQPEPEMAVTWPPWIFPGEECLAYDGSQVPNCEEFVDPVTKQPYYHEHSQSKKQSFILI